MSMISDIQKIEDGGSGAFYIFLKKKNMIVWLSSYPKSGNTLLRGILSTYLFSNDGIFSFENLYKINQFPTIKKHFENLGIKNDEDEKILKNYVNKAFINLKNKIF